MSKLGWRIWLDKHSVWHKVLSFKNGDIKNVIHDNSMSNSNSKSSLWWRDLKNFVGILRC